MGLSGLQLVKLLGMCHGDVTFKQRFERSEGVSSAVISGKCSDECKFARGEQFSRF